VCAYPPSGELVSAQSKGDLIVIRAEGSGGRLLSGMWRTGMTLPSRNADDRSEMYYSSPPGDETFMVSEGAAVLTVVSTDK